MRNPIPPADNAADSYSLQGEWRISPGWQCRAIENGTVLLTDDRNQLLYTNPIEVVVLSALTEGSTLESVLQRHPSLDPAGLIAAFSSLARQRMIRPLPLNLSEAEEAFWWGRNLRPAPLSLSLSWLDIKPCSFELSALRLAAETAQRDLKIVFCADYLHPKIDAISLSGHTLLVRPTGQQFWIGPYFASDVSPCYLCLAFWLRMHRWRLCGDDGRLVTSYLSQPAVAALDGTLQAALGFAATTAERYAATGELTDLSGVILRVDPWTYEVQRIPFLPRGDCPRCKPETGAAVTLNRRVILEALANPLTGILENLQVAPSVAEGFSLANALVLCPMPARDQGLPFPPLSASGKGDSTADAREKVLLEAIERHSAVFRGDEKLHLSSASSLSRFEAAAFLQFSARQYNRRIPSRSPDDPDWIPERFPDSGPVHWVEAKSLISADSCFVPAGISLLGYSAPGEVLYAVADTNGCAAAWTYQRAVLNGLLELIERDAFAIWWYNRIRRPAWEPSDDPRLRALAATLAQHRRTLYLADLTHDLEIPVVAAYSAEENGSRVYIGAAADLCPRRAARRAAEEMFQFWFWGRKLGDNRTRARWLGAETLDSQNWLRPLSFNALPEPRAALDAEHQVAEIIRGLQTHGFDPLYIDLTRPWLRVPVVRILVPGLRSHAARFAPGRLYDVPVALGWLARATREEDLFYYETPI